MTARDKKEAGTGIHVLLSLLRLSKQNIAQMSSKTFIRSRHSKSLAMSQRSIIPWV